MQLVAKTVPIAALWCIPDGFLGTIQGVLRSDQASPGQWLLVLSVLRLWLRAPHAPYVQVPYLYRTHRYPSDQGRDCPGIAQQPSPLCLPAPSAAEACAACCCMPSCQSLRHCAAMSQQPTPHVTQHDHTCCRGMGKQAQMVWISLVGFWGIGAPDLDPVTVLGTTAGHLQAKQCKDLPILTYTFS